MRAANTAAARTMLSSASSTRSRNFEQAPKVQYPTSASDYKVLEEIGRGVSAKVYRAECLPLNETVAVKMMDLEDQDPGHLEEIRREVASMSMVSHPNLVTVHCSFVEGQFLWVVMPFLSGGSALNIMKWSHPKGLDETSIATILKEVLKVGDERGITLHIRTPGRGGEGAQNTCQHTSPGQRRLLSEKIINKQYHHHEPLFRHDFILIFFFFSLNPIFTRRGE